MRGIRRVGAMAVAGVFAAGLTMVAPSGVVAGGTGCGGSFTLEQGQSTQCWFVYSGPNASGDYTDSASVDVTGGGPALFSGTLETVDLVPIDTCFGVSLAGGGGCGEGHSGVNPSPPATVGTTVICQVSNWGEATLTGTYACSTGV